MTVEQRKVIRLGHRARAATDECAEDALDERRPRDARFRKIIDGGKYVLA